MAHVLVVDDDAPTRDAIRLLLEDEGHTVACVTNGHEALTFLRASSVPLIVLLDYLMPGTDGGAVLRAMADETALARRHHCILVTAAAPAHLASLADVLTQLSVEVLAKPFDLDALLTLVTRAEERLGSAVCALLFDPSQQTPHLAC